MNEQMLSKMAGGMEIMVLEHALEDEIKCESKHISFGNTTCSGSVTHLLSSKHKETRACENHARNKMHDMARGRKCADCGEPAAACWEIRPI
jgi:hypothetical protein